MRWSGVYSRGAEKVDILIKWTGGNTVEQRAGAISEWIGAQNWRICMNCDARYYSGNTQLFYRDNDVRPFGDCALPPPAPCRCCRLVTCDQIEMRNRISFVPLKRYSWIFFRSALGISLYRAQESSISMAACACEIKVPPFGEEQAATFSFFVICKSRRNTKSSLAFARPDTLATEDLRNLELDSGSCEGR